MMRLLTKLINAGVVENLHFITIKRIRVFNLAAIFGFLIGWVFVYVDYSNHRTILVLTDLCYVFASFFLIFSNYKRKYQLGYLVTIAILTISFSISSILYKSGMEYFLFLLLVMSLIYKADKNVNYGRSILIFSTLFIIITIINYNYTFYKDLGEANRIESIIIWLFLQTIFLRFFSKMNNYFKRDLEAKNNLLNHQQKLLVEKVNEFESSNQKLQKMNEAKEKIFSIIAHDVKSPIAAIRSTLDLFNSDALSKNDFLELSKGMSIRMKQLKDNLDVLLEWSKSQMQGIEVNAEVVSLEVISIDTINLLLPNIELKKIKIHLKIDEHLKVFADPNHVSLILRNLIANAVKYSYQGSEINISANKNNNYVFITVQDFGTGMDDTTKQSLFNTFNIDPQYGTLNERGTGLGLILCKEFLEKNNGFITVESQRGKGTSFTFSLPAA